MFALQSVLLVCLAHWLEAIDQEKMSVLLNANHHHNNNQLDVTPMQIGFRGQDLHPRDRQLGDILSQLMNRLNRINPSRIRTTTTRRRNRFNLGNVTTTTTTTTTTTEAPPMSQEGQLRLVGGRTHFEGNVEIMHNGRWGAVCDDEWDQTDADIACRQIGFVLGAIEATANGRYGKARSEHIWMDNVFCQGDERTLADCVFDGWAQHDCQVSEPAGVVCRTRPDQVVNGPEAFEEERPTRRPSVGAEPTLPPNSEEEHVEGRMVEGVEPRLSSLFGENIETRLVPSRLSLSGSFAGRVEVRLNGAWNLVCGDGFGMNEAQVICRQLGFEGVESILYQPVSFADSNARQMSIFSGAQCRGDETRLSECSMSHAGNFCPDSHSNMAGVVCTAGNLPDLVPDAAELQRSAFIEDRPLIFLQCAMEEACLSRSAYEIDRQDPSWIGMTRRLLRFTARIKNVGRVDFRPAAAKHQWMWHSCHRHYHSMETFAQFDILNPASGRRVAEGHKASFCLEDNECDHPSGHKYACAHFGDQGISVGCVDTYKAELDCQWIDITDVPPGDYQLRLAVNPDQKVSELSYDNNDVLCRFLYTEHHTSVSNCSLATGPRSSRHF